MDYSIRARRERALATMWAEREYVDLISPARNGAERYHQAIADCRERGLTEEQRTEILRMIEGDKRMRGLFIARFQQEAEGAVPF